jgi:hypothetical protein
MSREKAKAGKVEIWAFLVNLFVWGISTYSGIPGVRSELAVYSVNIWIFSSR